MQVCSRKGFHRMATPVTFPDHYTLTVEMTANSGAHTWRNSIDIAQTPGAVPPAYADAVVTAFTSFLVGITRDDTTITKVSLRNWTRGDIPFADQSAIWVQSTNLACKNWGAGSAYPAATNSGNTPMGELTVLIAKGNFNATGKTGHLGIRNAVKAEDTTALAGGPPTFTTAAVAVYTTAINNWIIAKLLPKAEAAALPAFCNIHYSKKEGTRYATEMALPVFERLSTHNISRKRTS
jgi:hypothetical protein